jgi:hypothetical protein
MAAIYQWFVEDLQILTTTLYPIEVFEKLQFGISLVSGNMTAVPLEDFIFDILPLGGNIESVLYTTPLHDEAFEFDILPISGTIQKILYQTPMHDEAFEFDILAVQGNIREALVPALMPDEGMRFGCSLISGSMTHI